MRNLIADLLCKLGLHHWQESSRPAWAYSDTRGWKLNGERIVQRCIHCGEKRTKL